MSSMCDSFIFEQEIPALDDSPTIPIMALPGCSDEEDDQQVNFLPGMPAKKPADTARRSTSFITDTDLSDLIAQDAFPSSILDAIEVGSIHAGTKAREARLGELSHFPKGLQLTCLARSQQSRSVSDGTWQPYNKHPFTQRRASLDAAPSRPPLNFAHTAPPDLPGYAPMARSASLTSAPAEAPPTLSKSQPPVLPIAPQPTSTVPTSSSKRYRALRSPTTSICRPATPLHSIPETPKDLDVAPEGSWALRCWPEGSSKLMQSRSAPNMKVSKRSVGPEGLKRSLSGLDVDRGDGSDSKKTYLSVALQMRCGSAPLGTYLASHKRPVQPIHKTRTRSSSLVRSPRIQSLNMTAPNKPTNIRNSLRAEDIHCWPPLVIKPKRSGPEPVPAVTPRPETPTASTMREHGMVSDASGAPIPPRPPKSHQRIIRAEKKEKRSRVICFPPDCAPCILTPDSDVLTFSSLSTEREKEEEDTEDVWKAVAEAEKWVWPEPPSKTLTPRILITSFTNPFSPEPTIYNNKNDHITPKVSRSIYRGTNDGADLSKVELRLNLLAPMEKEGEGKKFKSWAKDMRRKLRA